MAFSHHQVDKSSDFFNRLLICDSLSKSSTLLSLDNIPYSFEWFMTFCIFMCRTVLQNIFLGLRFGQLHTWSDSSNYIVRFNASYYRPVEMLQSDASEFITRDKRKICFFLLNSKFLTDISKSNQIWNRPRVQLFKIFMNFHFQRCVLTHISQLKDIQFQFCQNTLFQKEI